MELNRMIDHTLLKPESTEKQIENLCKEALEYNFKSVCINPCWVAKCHELLNGSEVSVCTVIGFPLGANSTNTKFYETEEAIKDGADEVDMVINIGKLKSGLYEDVKRDIEEVVKAAKGKIVKVIIETCLLSEDEKIKACKLSKEAGADFVKTSTGFSTAGAKVQDVKLMKENAGGLKVKASGGIRDLKTAEEMIKNGADRLGVSAGIEIIKELKLR